MSSYFLNLPFNDFDCFAEMAKKWELDYFQMQSGPVDIHASQIVNEEVVSAHFCASCSFRLLGAPPRDMWTVMLSSQMNSTRKWLLNGKPVSENAITVYPPGYDFNNFFQAGYECYTFSMSYEYLGQLCEDNEIGELFSVLKSNDIVECSVADKQSLWQRAMEHKFWVDRLDGAVGFAELTYWHENERELLRDILLTIVKNTTGITKYKLMLIPNILTAIDDYFKSHLYKDVTVSELSKLVGIKERTLQYHFQTKLGITPKQYLKAFRLNRAHKQLLSQKSSNPSTKISDIAFRNGFWHMGQFAADYRLYFGELPSETVMRA